MLRGYNKIYTKERADKISKALKARKNAEYKYFKEFRYIM